MMTHLNFIESKLKASIENDVKLGGGIYVLNNYDNMDGIGNFGSLVGKICDYLK
ncbi:MAG TPA: hypothetical protein P5216_01990 [Bacteroidota bacterium]|nr:hypothetical protein [Bacteroidota bacterium]